MGIGAGAGKQGQDERGRGRQLGRDVGQGGGQGGGIGVALFGRRPARPFQHRGEGAELGRDDERLVDPGQQCRQGRLGSEGDLAGDRFHQHQGEGVAVAAGVDRAPNLFGGGIPGGAHDRPGRLRPARLGQRPGQPEIRHPHVTVLVEEEVGRLDVPVDEAPGVGVGQGGGDLATHGGGLGRRETLPPVQQAPQAPTLEELEHHERGVVLAPVVDVDDSGVVEGGGQLGLGPEAAQEAGVVGQRGVEHLDRHPPAQPDVPGGVDPPRGAGSDGGDQAVAAGQHPAGQIGHAAGTHQRYPTGRSQRVRVPLVETMRLEPG